MTGADPSDPEVLLRQALRAQVGGPKSGAAKSAASTPGDDGRPAALGRFTAAQLLLIAAIVGAVIGMTAAFLVLARA